MDENLTKKPHFPILLADDETQTLNSYEMLLKKEGFNNIASCISAEETLEFLKEKKASLIILDLGMGGMSGQELLEKVTFEYPEIPIIVATSYNDVGTIVECIKNGAHDYLLKPIDWARFMTTIRNALRLGNLEYENIRLKNSLLESNINDFQPYEKIITNTELMFSIFLYIDSISITSQPVLITGETGTGKELIADAVHKASGRKGKFVSINVAGLDDSAFSDTLFGHKTGAFTGARETRKGLIENAEAGTLFLDEIGDLKESSQVGNPPKRWCREQHVSIKQCGREMLGEVNFMTKTTTKNHQGAEISSGSIKAGLEKASFVRLMMINHGAIAEGSPNFAAKSNVKPLQRSVFRTATGLRALIFAVRITVVNTETFLMPFSERVPKESFLNITEFLRDNSARLFVGLSISGNLRNVKISCLCFLSLFRKVSHFSWEREVLYSFLKDLSICFFRPLQISEDKMENWA